MVYPAPRRGGGDEPVPPGTDAGARRRRRCLTEVRSASTRRRRPRPTISSARRWPRCWHCAGDDPDAMARPPSGSSGGLPESPLETLSEGARPNARQRAEAARAARDLAGRPRLLEARGHARCRRPPGRAGARGGPPPARQPRGRWPCSASGGSRPMTGAIARAGRGTLGGDARSRPVEPGHSRVAAPPARTRDARGTRPARAARPRRRYPVATLEQFEQAAQIARLAAGHGHVRPLAPRRPRGAPRAARRWSRLAMSHRSRRQGCRNSGSGDCARPAVPRRSSLSRLTELRSSGDAAVFSPSRSTRPSATSCFPRRGPPRCFSYAAPLVDTSTRTRRRSVRSRRGLGASRRCSPAGRVAAGRAR